MSAARIALLVVQLLAAAATGAILVVLYRRSRNLGYLILAVALSLWLPLSWGFFALATRIAFRAAPVPFPLTFLLSGHETPALEVLQGLQAIWSIVHTVIVILGLVLIGFASSTGDAAPPNSRQHLTTAASPDSGS